MYWLIPGLAFAQTNRTNFFALQHLRWPDILTTAHTENKGVMVYIYSTDCVPCIEMSQQIFNKVETATSLLKNVIAVNIQFDSLRQDNEDVIYWRNWYRDQQRNVANTKISDIPTFLFYSAQGSPVYKSTGGKTAVSLQNIAKFATNLERLNFNRDLTSYQSGKKEYSKMLDLARMCRNFLENEELTSQIARDYKEGYLDKRPAGSNLNIEEIKFLNDYGHGLLTPQDRFFQTVYNDPIQIDSILGAGAAGQYVTEVIYAYLIKPVLFKNGKRIPGEPNWRLLESRIANKYPKFDPEQSLLIEKSNYYKEQKNWNLYTKFKTEQIKKYPPANVFFELNAPAWEVFQFSNDSMALSRALEWINIAIHREPQGVQYLDTKANLLYKMGNKTEAIECERAAIALTAKLPARGQDGKPLFIDAYLEVLSKMENGQPTWR